MRLLQRAVPLVFLLLAAPLILRGQMSLSLSPVQTELTLGPGKSGTQVLTVGNGTSSPLSIRAEVGGWTVGRPGLDVFRIEGTEPLSARDWIRVENGDIVVPGGDQKEILLSVSVPETAAPGQYTASVSILTLAESGSGDPAGGLSLQGKLTALVMVTVGKPVDAGTVSDLALERKDGAAVLILRRKNASRFFLPTEGEIILRDAKGKKAYAADFIADPVPPLSERVFRIPIEADLAPGRYQAECVLRLLSGKKTKDKRAVEIE